MYVDRFIAITISQQCSFWIVAIPSKQVVVTVLEGHVIFKSYTDNSFACHYCSLLGNYSSVMLFT
jgi:hypothetical protein